MACIDEIICLGEYCSCGTEIDLNLISSVTGIITMEAEFNGIKLTRDIEVSNGSKVEVPNIFNENYTHILAFYTSDGELVNNVKYSIKTVYCDGYTPVVDEAEYDHDDYDPIQYN